MLGSKQMSFRWMRWVVLLVGLSMLTGCPKAPKKALSDAQQALLDARGVKDCASDKFKAAQRLLDEAEKLAAQEKYDESERKAKAAKQLAVEAKAEGEANWDDCMEKQKIVEKAEDLGAGDDEGEEAPEENLSLETVYFGYDSADLEGGTRDVLDENGQWLKKNADRRVIIEGHTDERGTPEYNLALGESRARGVKQYMIQLGVDAGRMSILSYGEEKPAAYGATPSDYAKNRRVEFVPKN
jgi:peptidoglycan-associated lipoprotein